MEHQRWIQRSLRSAAVAASIGLTACGGGGGDSGSAGAVDSTTTLSGIVADGYLVNATVCLDLNLSKTCDSDEPKATSTSGGKYSLDATQAQIDTYPIVAEIIAGITVDEDNSTGTPVTKAYTLSAPAGKGAFVSPLTTMVQAQIETTGKTAEQIENEILASIGQDPAVVSLFDDYVAEKTDSTNSAAVQESYLQLHQIAQVTASTIANNIEYIEAAVTSGEIMMDLSKTLDSLITIIVQNVIAELTAIATEIDSATTFDADTIATTVVPPVDTTTIVDQVAVVETPSVSTSNVEAVFTSGISWLWAEYHNWNSELELERSFISYDPATGKLSEPIESYFATATPGWAQLPNGSDQLVLQTNGIWLAVTDSWDDSPASFDNTAGTATIESHWGSEVLSNVKATDLSGLSIKQLVANKLPDLAKYIDPASVFTAGSEAYSLNLTSLEDSYAIPWDDCGTSIQKVQGNCNTVIDYSSGSAVVATSFSALLNPAAAVNTGEFSSLPRVFGVSAVANLYYEMVQGATNTSGSVVYYHNPPGTNTLLTVGTGTWEITTVNGIELLMVDHPDALMSQFLPMAPEIDSPEENHFYVIQDFVVRRGDHFPANIVEDVAESLLTNQQAQNEITGAFLSTTVKNTVPSAELACDTASDWNPLIDEPLVAFSFAGFESVVTRCGGALAITANALADDQGSGTGLRYDSYGTSITFKADSTGSYSSYNNPVRSFDFTWTIDPMTNYITLENIDGSSRDILAITALDTTNPPFIAFEGYSYIEEIGRSNMITNQGTDGQIVDYSPWSFTY